ncbi:MAG: hypothetical protein P8M53_13465 [Pirellulales bacterium]|nr:hypothetical protein [Pirellulales bacterium]
MKQERFRRIWMMLSAFGIVFAVLSWFHEAMLSGNAILWKGPLAVLLGLGLYFIFVDRV